MRQATTTGELSNQPKSSQHQPSTYALQDSEILELLAGLPQSTMGRRYGFAFQLMATYGLRAAELRYLQVRNQESELWLRGRRNGAEHRGRSHESCKLEAVPVVNTDGTPQEWNLMSRVALGERLPPLGSDSEASQHLESYLNDRPVWREVQDKALRSGEQAMIESFRQRYACAAHRLGSANQSIDEQL